MATTKETKAEKYEKILWEIEKLTISMEKIQGIYDTLTSDQRQVIDNLLSEAWDSDDVEHLSEAIGGWTDSFREVVAKAKDAEKKKAEKKEVKAKK